MVILVIFIHVMVLKEEGFESDLRLVWGFWVNINRMHRYRRKIKLVLLYNPLTVKKKWTWFSVLSPFVFCNLSLLWPVPSIIQYRIDEYNWEVGFRFSLWFHWSFGFCTYQRKLLVPVPGCFLISKIDISNVQCFSKYLACLLSSLFATGLANHFSILWSTKMFSYFSRIVLHDNEKHRKVGVIQIFHCFGF